jgi:nitrite reductase/ring-hydroxylating ferredoxin subunit
MTAEGMTRRVAVRGAALAGVGVPLLVACGSEDDSTEAETTAGSGSTTGSEDASPTTEPGAALATTADIPVGGGKVFDKEKVVVVQPAEGDFKAYSAVCPHQACIFTEVADSTIKCGGCHRAEFTATDGTNTMGPNGSEPTLPALAAVEIAVDGDSITLA